MLFNTYEFTILFAPISIVSFYLARQYLGLSLALAVAIAFSLAFYAWWRVDYVPVLVASVLINYGLGTAILNSLAPRALLATGALLNLGFLGYFKYAGFAISQINSALQFDFKVPEIILPLAVSFYTFQQIAYLVDCYRGKIRDNSFLHYVFVVTFFPHLIAGPIVRMQEISHQFAGMARRVASSDIAVGLALFVAGLGKKVLVADYFGTIANPLYAAAVLGPISFGDAWTAALSYTLQLYFDFSGYSDMAIGLARMFGFRLAVNFLSPYQACDIADFWRRWHVTLSRFLRDYLYIPLGGNRRGELRTCINLLATMALGGLWHGTAWTFVVWGLFHGILLVLHRFWRSVRPAGFDEITGYRLLAGALTFLCVVVGWVLFRSPDFATAGRILVSMSHPAMFNVQGNTPVLAITIGLMFCWIAPNIYQVLYRYRPALLLREQIPLLRRREFSYRFGFRTAEGLAMSAVLIVALYFMQGTQSTFLYFMF